MISKFLFLFFSILQNQEIQNAAQELTQAKKIHNLSQLVSLLTIVLITILILLIIYLYKNYKLQKKIRSLELSVKA
jgi:heme/copper-type cytochrome/quinol oxidase subunit 2